MTQQSHITIDLDQFEARLRRSFDGLAGTLIPDFSLYDDAEEIVERQESTIEEQIEILRDLLTTNATMPTRPERIVPTFTFLLTATEDEARVIATLMEGHAQGFDPDNSLIHLTQLGEYIDPSNGPRIIEIFNQQLIINNVAVRLKEWNELTLDQRAVLFSYASMCCDRTGDQIEPIYVVDEEPLEELLENNPDMFNANMDKKSTQ